MEIECTHWRPDGAPNLPHSRICFSGTPWYVKYDILVLVAGHTTQGWKVNQIKILCKPTINKKKKIKNLVG